LLQATYEYDFIGLSFNILVGRTKRNWRLPQRSEKRARKRTEWAPEELSEHHILF